MKMRNKFLNVISFAATLAMSSCSLFTRTSWDWFISTENDTISYCQLIGQLDHNDSMLRTKGVREQINTRVDEASQMANPNLESTKIGTLTLGVKDDGSQINPNVTPRDFKIKELEHLEQKSLSGATWDPITANNTAATWTAKHNKNITFFASNNDAMSEGAIKASNWYEGMPIFGYDANASTLKLIKENKIIGTVDSNTVGQCLTSSILIRNIVNASRDGTIKDMADAGQKYNPIKEGFTFELGSMYETYGDYSTSDYTYSPLNKSGSGYMHSRITFDGCLDEDIDADKDHALYLHSRSVTNFSDVMKDYKMDPSAIEPNFFFKEGTDEILPHKDFYEKSEKFVEDENPITPDQSKCAKKINLWQCWYSDTDVFFTGNMNPYFSMTQEMFNIDVTPATSNGADESKLLDALKSALTKDTKPDAFLINVVQQPNSFEYIKTIAEKLDLNEEDEWENRSDIPIVFWNRQPTDRNGNISKDVMHNKWFKYTYYVGVDANAGGQLQGKMIKTWLNKTFVEKELEKIGE